jgi:hypothetical protein
MERKDSAAVICLSKVIKSDNFILSETLKVTQFLALFEFW